MNYKILILISMIFCHIVDDYYLQGWLASAKQKSWWEKNASDKMYRHDYIAALFMHSFSWTFSVMLVPTIYIIVNSGIWNPSLFVGNLLLHMWIDDLKANRKKINLIQDQVIHMVQIAWTWYCMVVC